MSETPVGQAPVTGGRVRRYATAAERARAFRERQAVTRGGAGDPGALGPDDRPELAVASLAGVVASLQQLLGSAQAGMAEQVERAQAVVALLSDPAAIDERLELNRADVGRQLAEAEDRVARSRTEAGRARAGEEAAAAERDSALAAAAEAWENTQQAQEAAAAAELARDEARAERDTARAELAEAVAVTEDLAGRLAAATAATEAERTARAQDAQTATV